MVEYEKLFNQTNKESEWLDYKEKINFKKIYYDLLIDVNAFANNDYYDSQYIVYGVKENDHAFEYIGLAESPTIKVEDMQQWIYEAIEPKIIVNLIQYEFEKKKYVIIQIDADKSQRPFIFKKEYNCGNDNQDKRKIYPGDAWIRIGPSTRRLLREDFESIYAKRNVIIPIEVNLYDNELFISDIDPGNLMMTIKNPSTMNQIFMDVHLEILDENDKRLSMIKMLEFLEISNEKGNNTTSRRLRLKSDLENVRENFLSVFTLNVPKEKVLFGVGVFAFSSTDAIKVGLNEYGESDIKYTFKLYFTDNDNKTIEFTFRNCSIYAKGEVLWKIKKDKEYTKI